MKYPYNYLADLYYTGKKNLWIYNLVKKIYINT